jgi:hypothetical protein
MERGRLVGAGEIPISEPEMPCPCGSGSQGLNCCLDEGGRMRRAPKPLPVPRLFQTDYQHPRCYAAHIGGCSRKLTAEHYYNHSFLRRLAEDGARFHLSKFKWLPPGESRVVSPANMTAKVLCSNHNSVLAGYDEIADRFLTALLRAGETGDENCMTVQTFNGEDLERCLLKTLCGVTAMEAAREGGWKAPMEWLRMLFKVPRSFISGFGLFMNLGVFEMFPGSTPSMSATPIDNPDGPDPLGLRLHFSGVEFVLMTGNTGRSRWAYNSRYRPGLLSINSAGYCSVRIGIHYEYSPLGLHLRMEGLPPGANPAT